MTDRNPFLWSTAERQGRAHSFDMINLTLELRDRLEALEAAENERRFREGSKLIDEATPEQMQAAIAQQAATRAAQWGADQELEACCEWLGGCGCESYGRELRAARRPKPPGLKEQALKILSQDEWSTEEEGIVRRALEALDD